MVAEPVISSMWVLCGTPRTLIENSMRKHMPSSVEELDRICGEFVGAGPVFFWHECSPGVIRHKIGNRNRNQADRVSAWWSQ